jgi:nitrile hydratase subunit beta
VVHNGPHDVGGVPGFGAIETDTTRDVAFPEGWEGSCIASILATMLAGKYNVDQFRARQEELPPAAYWTVGYYRRWYHTLERNLVLEGTLSEGEIDARAAAIADGSWTPPAPRQDPELEAAMRALVEEGAAIHKQLPDPPRFAPGDRVRTIRIELGQRGVDHTRLPGYLQEQPGIVERVYPPMPLPDRTAHGEDVADHLYVVSFAASELWPDGDPTARISADLFESYLVPEEG